MYYGMYVHVTPQSLIYELGNFSNKFLHRNEL